MTLERLDPGRAAARAEWDHFVVSCGGATVFHSTRWLDAVSLGLGFQSRYFLSRNRPGGSIEAVIPLFETGSVFVPRRWMNLPQGVPGGPLARDPLAGARFLEALVQQAGREGIGALIVSGWSQRGTPMPPGWVEDLERPNQRHGLGNSAHGQGRMTRRYRSEFRRLSEEGGFRRSPAPGEEADFSRLMHRIMLARHGHVPWPPSFVRSLRGALGDRARLHWVVDGQGRGFGFSLSIWEGKRGWVLLAAGVPSPGGLDGGILALGGEVTDALKEGLSDLDLGETGPRQEGVRIHKERWGALCRDDAYWVARGRGRRSGLRTTGEAFSSLSRALRYCPPSLSLVLSGPAHRWLQ